MVLQVPNTITNTSRIPNDIAVFRLFCNESATRFISQPHIGEWATRRAEDVREAVSGSDAVLSELLTQIVVDDL
jgi:hypothetical protein